MEELKWMVAVIGAGPAGLYASRLLAEGGCRVALFNRDIRPGGLAEYGIYPDKLKMKQALRAEFKRILALPRLDYFGNVRVCCAGNITLENLLEAGFQAVLVATGAQGTKWLRLPGENLPGVYHAKNIVYHYNRLPPFSEEKYLIGKQAAIVGAGNVMIDIARYLIHEKKVEEVIVVARRGPAEVKFSRKELEHVASNMDLSALDVEFQRVAPMMEAVGQEPAAVKANFLAALPEASPPVSETRLRFEFLASPVRVMGDWLNGVSGLKVEDNILVAAEGRIKARGTGYTRQISADTIIFAIGDTVDEDFCIPVYNDAYMTVPEPRFPIMGISYEAFNPDINQPLEGVFLGGWARQASTGLVGIARRDGENAARAMLQFLQSRPPTPAVEDAADKFAKRLREIHQRVVEKSHLEKLEQAERRQAEALGVEDFRFATNEEMFAAIGL